MMGEGVTQWTLGHNGGTQVSLGGSQERVMREERKGPRRCPGIGAVTLLLLVCPRRQGPCLAIFASSIWHGELAILTVVGTQQILMECLLESCEDQ